MKQFYCLHVLQIEKSQLCTFATGSHEMRKRKRASRESAGGSSLPRLFLLQSVNQILEEWKVQFNWARSHRLIVSGSIWIGRARQGCFARSVRGKVGKCGESRKAGTVDRGKGSSRGERRRRDAYNFRQVLLSGNFMYTARKLYALSLLYFQEFWPLDNYREIIFSLAGGLRKWHVSGLFNTI